MATKHSVCVGDPDCGWIGDLHEHHQCPECKGDLKVGVKCCGELLLCFGFANTCSCDADYNWSGQRLASRQQWGEETGEMASDILHVEAEHECLNCGGEGCAQCSGTGWIGGADLY